MYAGTSGAIHLNQDTNHLQIALHTPEIVGMDTYGFYINGTQVGQDWGWPTTTDLRVGLMAVSDAAGFDARFDNYKFVPEGCPANSQSSMRQPGKSPTQMFELPLISLPSQRAWPIRLNHAQPLIDR